MIKSLAVELGAQVVEGCLQCVVQSAESVGSAGQGRYLSAHNTKGKEIVGVM